MDIARTISGNLTAWMEADPSLDTFKKVAARSGVGFGTVQRAKNGDGNLTVEKLALIARAFGRSPADLLVPAAATPTAQPTRLPTRTMREQRIDAINACLAKTDDYGLVAMLEKAKDVARDYPLRQSETGS